MNVNLRAQTREADKSSSTADMPTARGKCRNVRAHGAIQPSRVIIWIAFLPAAPFQFHGILAPRAISWTPNSSRHARLTTR
jgi:hypothetical protein